MLLISVVMTLAMLILISESRAVPREYSCESIPAKSRLHKYIER
jgi:hypothetical protein